MIEPLPAAARPARRLLATLMALFLMAVGVLAGATPAAAQSGDEHRVSIEISAMEPALPGPDDTITLRGTVTNTSDGELSSGQVMFWRNQSPITTDDDLSTALESDPTEAPFGRRLVGKPENLFALTSDAEPTLGPGQSRPFEVRSTVADLELPRTAGVYLIGVHVRGQIDRTGNQTLGRARTFVQIAGNTDPAKGPVVRDDRSQEVASVVALSSQPTMIRPGIFINDNLAAELGPGGRLRVLLESARRPNVSWIIDPALITELEAMARGYQIEKDGKFTPGTGQAAARQWLADFGDLDTSDGFRSPYGTPDVAALSHNSDQKALQASRTAGDEVERTKSLPLIGWTRGGELDAEALATMETLEPTAVLTSTADSEQTLLQPVGKAPLVRYSAGTFAGGPGPDPRATASQVRQRLLAESWIDAGTSNPQALRVISEPVDAVADEASSAPWLRRVRLQQLLAGEPGEWSGQFDYTDRMRERELRPQQLQGLTNLASAYASISELMVDPATNDRIARAALARSSSSWWRGNDAGFLTFIDPQFVDVNSTLGGGRISLTVQKQFVMSGSSGNFPVTVNNKMDQAIRLNLHFVSQLPQRLSVEPVEEIVVAPGQSLTVPIHPRAVGNGPVQVTAQLTTVSGVPVGKRQSMTIDATNLGAVGWVIVIVSGAVLLATTALRIRQVRRERHSDEEQPPQNVINV